MAMALGVKGRAQSSSHSVKITAVAPLPPRPSFNPLAIRGTVLPVNLLLMAKLLTLTFLIRQVDDLPEPFLPFLSIFDNIGSPVVFQRTLQTIFVLAAISLFVNRYVRASCLILGSVIVVTLLSARLYFENNRTFIGCMLLLVGLYQFGPREKLSLWLVRLQVPLLYFGAALNKVLDVDWRSGQFFENWMVHILNQPFYITVSSWLPHMTFSWLMSWTTIVIEIALCIGFLVRRLFPWAIWVGIAYHTALLLFTGRTFGLFFYGVLSSYLAFVKWPPLPMTVLYDAACEFCVKGRRLLEGIDLEDLFHWVPNQPGEPGHAPPEDSPHRTMQLIADGKTYAGFEALKMILLYNPVTYFVLDVILVVLMASQLEWVRLREWIVVLVFLTFSPLFSPVGRAVYNRGARLRRRTEVGGNW
jgi:hypothetical protein